MTTLENYVKEKFNGMLVFGDVHADYESIQHAYQYAKKNNYFFQSLGDLVDRGPKPFKTVKLMYEVVSNGLGGMVVGNHDNKFYRYANGADVKFSRDAKKTLEDVGKGREYDFLKMYCSIIEAKPFSDIFHKFGDITLVHAAPHHCLWDNTPITKSAQSRFTVGETSGELYPDGYPVRLYNWIEEIPMDKTVMVGHDSHPIHNVLITEPMIVTNKDGGKAIFMDTGCGKAGYLSGAVVKSKNDKFFVEDMVAFK
jgi:protein phosphatase